MLLFRRPEDSSSRLGTSKQAPGKRFVFVLTYQRETQWRLSSSSPPSSMVIFSSRERRRVHFEGAEENFRITNAEKIIQRFLRGGLLKRIVLEEINSFSLARANQLKVFFSLLCVSCVFLRSSKKKVLFLFEQKIDFVSR